MLRSDCALHLGITVTSPLRQWEALVSYKSVFRVQCKANGYSGKDKQDTINSTLKTWITKEHQNSWGLCLFCLSVCLFPICFNCPAISNVIEQRAQWLAAHKWHSKCFVLQWMVKNYRWACYIPKIVDMWWQCIRYAGRRDLVREVQISTSTRKHGT